MSVANDPAVRTSVAQLYGTFAVYPIHDLEPCAHCFDYADNKPIAERLKAVPLHEAAVDDLDAYAVAAAMTWGDEVDLKHFVPRILELLASDEAAFGTLQWAWFASVLAHAGVRSWPEAERAAIRDFFARTWAAVLKASAEKWDAGDLLEAIALVDDDVERSLDVWSAALERGDAAALQHLVQFASTVQGDSDPRWHWGAGRGDQARRVRDWLNADLVQRRLRWVPPPAD